MQKWAFIAHTTGLSDKHLCWSWLDSLSRLGFGSLVSDLQWPWLEWLNRLHSMPASFIYQLISLGMPSGQRQNMTMSRDTQVLSQASDIISLSKAYHMFRVKNQNQKEGRDEYVRPLIFTTWNINLWFSASIVFCSVLLFSILIMESLFPFLMYISLLNWSTISREIAGPYRMNVISTQIYWASLVAQRVKNLPAIQETWVRSLGQEDPLEKGMTTHCSILTQRIPWTEEPGELLSGGSQRVRRD